MTDRRRRWTVEDGIAATQLAVLMPAILTVIMLTVQLALWAHGSHLAAAAADLAATTAALPDTTPAEGETAARDLLDRAGNLTDVDVTVHSDLDSVTATVRAAAPHLVPGLRFGVDAVAAAPLERFIPQGDR